VITLNKLPSEIPDDIPAGGSLCSARLTKAQFDVLNELATGTRDGKDEVLRKGESFTCPIVSIVQRLKFLQ